MEREGAGGGVGERVGMAAERVVTPPSREAPQRCAESGRESPASRAGYV